MAFTNPDFYAIETVFIGGGGGRQCIECLESRFAVRSDSNRHRFAAISNRAIRIARPKTHRIDVAALLFFTFKI